MGTTARSIKGPPLEPTLQPSLWQVSEYIHLYVPYFLFLRACLSVHVVENTISLLILRAQQACCNHSSLKVGSPAETLPFCGAGLGPSHLNLAGLTWNSLPVGLPQTCPSAKTGGHNSWCQAHLWKTAYKWLLGICKGRDNKTLLKFLFSLFNQFRH